MIGQTIGPYQILAELGRGGMGEVYRATDTNLKRSVAIKVLPAAVAGDVDRLARFQREAEVLAALNHPNIAAIYGLEKTPGLTALVMELVEGEDLSAIIARHGQTAPAAAALSESAPAAAAPSESASRGAAARGGGAPRAMDIEDVLPIAKQIADALEAAHEHGIIHRDLKPANIKIRTDGTVKVLDFGLAKAVALEGASATPDAMNSPTVTSPALTAMGMILGTAAYMAPEQARGRPVDKRADIWAFGCVLCEMLTGRPAFRRDTITDTLSAIVRDEPAGTLPAALPPRIAELIHRCLEKDPRQRLRDIGDARILLGEATGGAITAATPASAGVNPPLAPRRRSSTSLVVTGLVMAAIASAATWYTLHQGPAPVLFGAGLVKITTDAGLTVEPAAAPNGSLIAYASDRGGQGLDIWVQPLPAGEPVQITRHPADDRQPDFSPDGSRIVFRSERDGGGVYEVSALGGTERLIAERGRSPRFSPDGKWISYATGGRAVEPAGWVTDGRGSPPRQLAPSMAFIPSLWCRDGKLVIGNGGSAESIDWYAVDVESGAVTRLNVRASLARVGPVQSRPAAWLGDSILFTSDSDGSNGTSLWALPMNGCRGPAGSPQRLTMGTGQDLTPAVVSTADEVRLLYANVDRRANIYRLPLPASPDAPVAVPITGDATFNVWPSMSSDGRVLAFAGVRAGQQRAIVADLTTKTTRDVSTWGSNNGPTISPDGQSVAILAKGGISIQPVAGGDARLVAVEGNLRFLWDWPRPSLLTGSLTVDNRAVPIAVNTATGRSTTIVDNPSSEFLGHARLSPDGRWMSLMDWSSADRGRVIIVPFDGATIATASQIIPITDGQTVVEENAWSPDGGTLYVISEADGYRCIWSRRLDSKTKRPVGPLTAVAHFHRARQQIAGTAGSPQRLDMSPGGLVFAMAERHGNLWMATMRK